MMIGFGVSQLVGDRPAANLSSVDFKSALAQGLTGGKTVGSWGFAVKAFVQQGLHFVRPGRSMIAARNSGCPGGLPVKSAGL